MIKKQSTGFIFKCFISIFITFFLVFAVLLVMSRPVAKNEGVISHIHVDLLQSMLASSMRGMNTKEAQEFIESITDPAFEHAELLPLTGMTSELLSRRLGVPLLEFEEACFSKYEAFVAESQSFQSIKERGFLPKGTMRGKRIDDFYTPSVFNFSVLLHWLGIKEYGPKSDMRQSESTDKISEKPQEVAEQTGINNNLISSKDHTLDISTENQGKGGRLRRQGPRARFLVVPLPECDQMLYVRYDIEESPIIPAKSLILGAITSLLIMLAMALILVLPIIIRIHRYEHICEEVARGNYKARCDEKRNDMLGMLAHHIDEMTSANASHMEQQKSLLQAVAHEMRTPLSRIRFALELLDIPEDDKERQERLESIDEDLTEVDSLIKELSYFNYVDSGNGRQHFDENDVRQMIDQTLKRSAPTVSTIEVSVDGLDKDYMITVDATAFRRAIGNLLGNAQRYAKSKIVVCVRAIPDYLEVAIEDDGPGIPVESRKVVLLPFASIDKARNKAHSGFGLGLAIVDRIMKVHDGMLLIEDSAIGGCRMVTRWPMQKRER